MGHRITLQPSGNTFEAAPGQAILKAGLEAGLFLPYSCRSGVCRTCRGRIVAGEVDFGNVHPTYLSDQDKSAGFALLCQARALSALTIELHELSGLDAIKPRMVPCRVVKIIRAAADVVVLKLKLPMNENMLFLAGQYVDFLLKDGKRRSYSIANPPSQEGVTDLELHIRHTPGGLFTDQVFTALKERDLLRFEGPLGTFFLRSESDKPVVLVATGTGFAPIKAIIEHAIRRSITRPMTLYWGGRVRRDLYMADLAQSWEAAHPHFRFVPVLSDATSDCAWTGRTGFVHRAVMDDFPDLSGHQVYACGAPVMVEAAKLEFSEHCRLPPEEFYADAFLTGADLATS